MHKFVFVFITSRFLFKSEFYQNSSVKMLKIVSNYTLTQYINKGQYGKVYKAINHDNSKYVAIKMINLDKFIQKPKLIQLTRQQIQILSKLQSNENIIKFKEIIKSNRFLYLVYEFCNGGTLEEYLQKKHELAQRDAVKLFRQLVNGYKSLYENNIIHRDIKPDNIFFKDQCIKLADFGFCKKLKFSDDLTQTSLGSPLYMAPQVLNHEIYGSKADIWSCGVILFQMLFGYTPFGTSNIKQLVYKYSAKDQVCIPVDEKYISNVLVELLRKMLSKDQFRRISWEDFFYEYSFTESGQIIHKQKDFQYDLMKLMKRNSSSKTQETKNQQVNKAKIIKFDWSKITQMNSSVHSQDCDNLTTSTADKTQNLLNQMPSSNFIQFNVAQDIRKEMNLNFNTMSSNSLYSSQKNTHVYGKNSQCQTAIQNEVLVCQRPSAYNKISTVYNLKKKTKQFESQHTKIFQLLTLIESLLQSNKDYESDSRVIYFLIYNLEYLLKQNVQKMDNFIGQNSKLLNELPQEKTKLEKLRRIFLKQHQDTKPKINAVKTTLLILQEVGVQVFRYPRKDIMRKVMKEFVQNYELEAENVLSFTEQGNREEAVKLLKIVWGVGLIFTQKNLNRSLQSIAAKPPNFRFLSILPIKQETNKKQISALINRYLVRIGI